MSPAPSTLSAATDGLPILSYKQLANPATRPAFLSTLQHTLSTVGFFYLIDFEQAVPTDLFIEMGRNAKRFFDLPLETRLLIDQSNSPHFRGYSTFKTETTFGKSDLRDQIDLGPERSPHPNASSTSPLFLHLQGPNQWLPEEILPGFKESTISYHTHLLDLSIILTRAIAETLLQPSSSPSSSSSSDLIDSLVLSVFSPQPHARMKIVRYPCVGKGASIDGQEAKPKEGEFGVGAHRDGGGLTILQQDEIGGLQVQRWDGTWIDAPPLPIPAFVCNVGQQLTHLSNNLYPSTTHRVLPNHNSLSLPRFSIPFFLSPDLEKKVVPIPLALIPWASSNASAEVVSEIRNGDLTVEEEETYGVSSWRGTSRSHRHVMERWYSEEQRRMDAVGGK